MLLEKNSNINNRIKRAKCTANRNRPLTIPRSTNIENIHRGWKGAIFSLNYGDTWLNYYNRS